MASELMTAQEIHEFGLQVLVQQLTAKGYEIEFAQPDKIEIPHIIAKQGELLVFILASTDVYPHKGTIADADKQALVEHAEKFNAQSACAYLGIANGAGVAAQDKELCGQAFKDAQFYTDFSGLEFIHFED